MTFVEPIRGVECTFDMIIRTSLVPSPYQRDLGTPLVNKLLTSVDIGFIVPILVVPNNGMYEVIDGQHRLAAADKLKSREPYFVPCIILPERFKDRPLFFNIEKSDNIRDQATKIYNLYNHFLETSPDTIESTLAASCGYMSYLISISFAYKEFDISSPSLVEPPCKKLDAKSFLGEPLSTAVAIRRHRGMLLRDLEIAVNEVCSDNSIKDYNLKIAIISQSSQRIWGSRVRNVDSTFEDGILELTETIRNGNWSWMAGR